MPSAVARRRQGYEHEIEIREHRLIVDEPEDEGGGDAGPDPDRAARGARSPPAPRSRSRCTRTGRNGSSAQVEVDVDYRAPSRDRPPASRSSIRIPAELTDEQRERLLVIAGKCPVHRTLAAQDVKIEDDLQTVAA